jgi:hypothetical protein
MLQVGATGLEEEEEEDDDDAIMLLSSESPTAANSQACRTICKKLI